MNPRIEVLIGGIGQGCRTMFNYTIFESNFKQKFKKKLRTRPLGLFFNARAWENTQSNCQHDNSSVLNPIQGSSKKLKNLTKNQYFQKFIDKIQRQFPLKNILKIFNIKKKNKKIFILKNADTGPPKKDKADDKFTIE